MQQQAFVNVYIPVKKVIFIAQTANSLPVLFPQESCPVARGKHPILSG